ncbi:MAG: MacB family efflux pump subunit, partial [Acinetobacter sp.]|nr:MacB family efflux pump subunit [Acinetobacter sp.]
SGVETQQRNERSKQLLSELGLGERLHHRPSQLSGGQQQRVSIARALMNGGDVILADEPTGALDKNSGIEVMRILRELNAKGHTIILVTHDLNVAKNATRIIEISDGLIISDRANTPEQPIEKIQAEPEKVEQKKQSTWRATLDRLGEAFRMALLAMNAHRMRTFLTMLGIIIGIASVVSIVALGNGSQQKILSDISSMGTNTITIFQGRGFGDNSRTANRRTLVPSDAEALAQQPYVQAVSPLVSTSVTARYQEIEASASIQGVGADFFNVRGLNLAQGEFFNQSDVSQRTQNIVIDENTRKTLFANQDPIGQIFFLNKLPVRVVGVLEAEKNSMDSSSSSLTVYLPYSTVMSRILGQSHVRNIIVRVKDEYPSSVAENAILSLIEQRHNAKDVFTENSDSIREMIEKTTFTMTLLISSVAVISLIVGGIGVMNIMLVSVTERTQEIGVRMAVGARQSDILQQFLIEAVLVCILGGVLGVLLSLGLGQILNKVAGDTFQMVYSTTSIVAAFACSSLIGIVFGFLPARNAARLNPVAALSRE